jgi:ankyrin repeat protein
MFAKISLMGTCMALLCAVVIAASTGDAQLPGAAMQNDIALVRSLLHQKVDVNVAQNDGMTALHWAAYKDNLEIARLLIAAGADAKRVTRIGKINPLFMAATNGDAAMIELLLKAGADANSANELGTTPLMVASASGNVEAVTMLLNHGAAVNAKEQSRQQTAVMFAAARDRAPVVRLLAKHGADVNFVSKITAISNNIVDEDGNPIPAPSRTGTTQQRPRGEGKVTGIGGMSALHYAARDGFMETARALVESGANVNRVNPMDKSTPLIIASINGQYDIARYLLEHGADPNLNAVDGLTPLYAALDSKWAPVAWTPTASTADNGIVQQKTSYLELMKALLDRGANPNAKQLETPWYNPPHHAQRWVQWSSTTPFWRAAVATDVEAMKLLVSRGADAKMPSDEKTTTLMAAAGVGWTGNFSVNAPDSFLVAAKYLVEDLGVDVNAVNTSGYTAIMGAAWRGDNELVQYFASKGAKLDVKTKLGWSVTDMANGPSLRSSVPVKHPETIALLEKLGAPTPINVDDEEILGIIKRKIGGAADSAADPPKPTKKP